jgi:hypothetical protein
MMMLFSLAGCGGSMVNHYDDYAANAQSDAQQMADSIMGEMEKLEQFHPTFASTNPTPTEE